MRRSQPASSNRAVALWLFVCCALIFAMALLGAITRLTQSGLSITDWEPVEGALPPLNHAAWVKAFAAYQQIPQFKILNSSMTLDAFKGIYFWEWLHRLWGRVIGLVFAFPLVYFLLTRRISLRLGAKLFAIFLLGGLQGFIGWFMVESGLSVRTSVSAYRLALHFFDAALLYALILWLALDLIDPRRGRRLVIPIRVAWHGWAALALLSVTI
jgi:cytochrome c oxidase assembly protein subunit 15